MTLLTPTETILEKLHNVRKQTSGWVAQCPAHEDRIQSLGVSEGNDGRALIHCYAGCDRQTVLAALQLTDRDLFPDSNNQPSTVVAEYEYRDAAGKLAYVVERRIGKRFYQRHPNPDGTWEWNLKGVTRYPYRLPQLLAAGDRWIFIVEGEKDVHTLETNGFVATTNSAGAGGWPAEFTQYLTGRKIAVLADNDPPGVERQTAICNLLQGHTAALKAVTLPNLPDKGDVTDWFAAGGTADQLKRLVVSSPEWGDQPLPKLWTAPEIRHTSHQQTQLVIPDLLPVGLTVFGGKPKVGKSFLALNLAWAVASGADVMRQHPVPNPGATIYLALEDTPARLSWRIDRQLGSRQAPASCMFTTEWRRERDGGLLDLQRVLNQTDQPKLVIIDTLAIFRSDRTKGEDIYQADYNSLRGLKHVADEQNIAIIVVTHLRKGFGTSDPFEEISGTTGITGAADASWVLTRARNSGEAVLHVTGREIEEHKLALRFDREHLLWESQGDADDHQRTSAIRAIVELLEAVGEQYSPTEIADELDLNRETVKKALQRALRSGIVQKTPGGRYGKVKSAGQSINGDCPRENSRTRSTFEDVSAGQSINGDRDTNPYTYRYVPATRTTPTPNNHETSAPSQTRQVIDDPWDCCDHVTADADGNPHCPHQPTNTEAI